MVLAVLELLDRLVVLLKVELEPVQAVAELQVEFAAALPIEHHQGLLGGVLSDQQGTVVPGGGDVFVYLSITLLAFVQKLPTLV